MDWVLTSTDQMLNEMEKNPSQATETIWKLSNSPIGKGTAAGVRTAAKVTIKAGHTSFTVHAKTINPGQEAVKMAAPVGMWALKEGVTAFVKIMSSTKKGK